MSLDVQTSPILIVEDDQTLRETMEWTLEDAGWPVTCAVDGREALEMAERSRP